MGWLAGSLVNQGALLTPACAECPWASYSLDRIRGRLFCLLLLTLHNSSYPHLNTCIAWPWKPCWRLRLTELQGWLWLWLWWRALFDDAVVWCGIFVASGASGSNFLKAWCSGLVWTSLLCQSWEHSCLVWALREATPFCPSCRKNPC